LISLDPRAHFKQATETTEDCPATVEEQIGKYQQDIGQISQRRKDSAQHWISLNFLVLKLFCPDPLVHSITF